MLPSEAAFAAAADALCINPDDTIVVYDRLGAFSSPRAWWTWHVFGHKRYREKGEGIGRCGMVFGPRRWVVLL